jgi:hypothetical protein
VAGTGGNEAQAEFNKQRLAQPCVCVTTFNMIAHGGKRSDYGKAVSVSYTSEVSPFHLPVKHEHTDNVYALLYV